MLSVAAHATNDIWRPGGGGGASRIATFYPVRGLSSERGAHPRVRITSMRLKLTVSAAATAALVLAAGLGGASADTPAVDGAVKVYGNSFSSQGAMKQLIRVRRSGNSCTRAFSSASGGRMKVTVGPNGTQECAYDPLVIGGPDIAGDDEEMDNLEVIAENVRIQGSAPVPSRLPKAFASVSIRDGNDGTKGYYLSVFPGATTPRWEVWRNLPADMGCKIVATGTNAVAGLSTDNTLALRVFESGLGGPFANEVSAKVNDTEVWSDGSPSSSIDPERTALSIGAASNGPTRNVGDPGCPNTDGGGAQGVTGSFDKVQVNVPDPRPDGMDTDDVKEKGKPSGSPTPAASCPGSPCEAIGRLTGYQTQIQGNPPKTNPYGMAQDTGQLIAWRLTLGDPNQTQMNFFQNFFGAGPRAGVGVLVKNPSYSNRFQLVRKLPGVDLTDQFFGHRITVAPGLAKRIDLNNKVGLIVGTWAPAFATGIPSSNTWRATREAGFADVDVPVPTSPPPCSPGADGINFKNGQAHNEDGLFARYRCSYNTARLMYTALIAVP